MAAAYAKKNWTAINNDAKKLASRRFFIAHSASRAICWLLPQIFRVFRERYLFGNEFGIGPGILHRRFVWHLERGHVAPLEKDNDYESDYIHMWSFDKGNGTDEG